MNPLDHRVMALLMVVVFTLYGWLGQGDLQMGIFFGLLCAAVWTAWIYRSRYTGGGSA